MNTFIINIMNKYGYFGILFLITIENIFPPIPSEVILSLGGFMTSQDSCTMNMFGVILFSTLGSIIGAILLYFLGYILNKERLFKIVDSKVGKILFLKKTDIDNSINSFNKKGDFSVFYSRFIPIVRSLISIPAGISKMNFSVFLLYTSIGSLIWNTVLIYLGNLVGENYMMVANVFNKYSKIVLILIILFIVYKIVKKIKKKN